MSGLRWTEEQWDDYRKRVVTSPNPLAIVAGVLDDLREQEVGQIVKQIVDGASRPYVELTLPYPPSGNRQSRTGNGVHYTPEEVKRFREEVAGIALACGVRTALEGRLEGSMVLHPKRPIRWKPGSELPRALDLDNAWKTTADAMQAAGVFLNDRQFRRVVLEYGEPVPGGCVVVTIRRMR